MTEQSLKSVRSGVAAARQFSMRCVVHRTSYRLGIGRNLKAAARACAIVYIFCFAAACRLRGQKKPNQLKGSACQFSLYMMHEYREHTGGSAAGWLLATQLRPLRSTPQTLVAVARGAVILLLVFLDKKEVLIILKKLNLPRKSHSKFLEILFSIKASENVFLRIFFSSPREDASREFPVQIPEISSQEA